MNKTDSGIITRTQDLMIVHGATNATNDGAVQTRYVQAEVVHGWPPPIPRTADFLPMGAMGSPFQNLGGFQSPIQAMEVRRTFEVKITQKAYNKMMFWVLNAPGEVSGYGHVERDGNSFLIDDVLILEQQNGGSHSYISEAATLKFMLMLKKRGLGHRLHRLWWHSHNDFGAFYSPTDHAQIDSLANSQFNVSIVTNKMFEPRCRVDFYRPVRYAVDFLPLKVVPDVSKNKAVELQAELDALTVKKAVRRAR